MSGKIRFVLLLLLCCCAVFPAAAVPASSGEISVVRTVRQGNPTLYCAGIRGNDKLSADVKSLLRASGWFEVVDSRTADYVLSGAVQGGRARFLISSGGNTIVDQTVALSGGRGGAKVLADAVLQKVFARYKLKGICNTRIAFCREEASGRMNIYLCDIDGGDVQKLTEFKSLAVEPNWFPDGKSIIYTKYNDTTTSVLQTTLNPVRTRTIGTYDGLNVGVAVNPDGKSLALVMSRDGSVDLYLKSLSANGGFRRLTRSKDVEASPAWNPAGNILCFAAGSYNGGRLYSISANGGSPQRLPGQKGESVKPGWSSDNKIVYSTRRDGRYVLSVLEITKDPAAANHAYRRNPDGLVMSRNPGGNWESPSWAPDNRHVVCSRTEGKTASLVIVDTWTGEYRKIPVAGKLLMPAWSPVAK